MSKNFVSYNDDVKKQMMDLETKALRESAKVLRKIVKANVPVDEGNLKKSIGTWVKKNRKTGEVSLQIGVYDKRRALKKGLSYVYYAHIIEFGSSQMRAKPFLKPTVLNNIEALRNAQADYLSQITRLKNPDYDDTDVDEVEDE